MLISVTSAPGAAGEVTAGEAAACESTVLFSIQSLSVLNRSNPSKAVPVSATYDVQ